jgi:hypothetical protein
MCGASTGTMNVYRIKTSDLEKARALGFVLYIEGISKGSRSREIERGVTSRGDPEHVSDADRAGAMVRSTRSFLEEKLKPIGACPGYSIASLFLPGHLIPAPFFDGFCSLPASQFREFFELRFVVRFLHELGDADRRLARQDRLSGPRLGRAEGCPTLRT